MAVETILSGIMQDNPKLGIALGLFGAKYGPKIAKGIDVGGGAALSRSQYKKGIRRAGRDPMHRETPFTEATTEFVPRAEAYITKPYEGRYQAMYTPSAGWNLMHGAPPLTKPFKFAEFSLLDMFESPGLIMRKKMQRSVAEEGRHYLQHREGSLLTAPIHRPTFKYKVFEGVIQEPKNPAWGHLKEDWIKVYRQPIEVEAALEQMAFFGGKGIKPTGAFRRLKAVGYTDKQIKSMLKAYQKARKAAFPDID